MKKLRNKLIKKLGRKGFTLIELLAVIVILALIMVVAIPQVLNSINSSRVSALHSKAKSIVETYSTAYAADMLLSGGTSNAKAQLKGVGDISSSWTCIESIDNFASWAGLNSTDYVLGTTGQLTAGYKPVLTGGNATDKTKNVAASTCSQVRKTASGSLEVVLVASKNGKFNVGGAVTYAYSADPQGYTAGS